MNATMQQNAPLTPRNQCMTAKERSKKRNASSAVAGPKISAKRRRQKLCTPSAGAPQSAGVVSASEESVHVFVRVRPSLSSSGTNPASHTCLDIGKGAQSLTIGAGSKQARAFQFDKVFGETSTQEDVFLAIGKAAVDNALLGYNGTIFAYGQTGSGKTHTMLGPDVPDMEATVGQQICSTCGLIPRILEYLFARMANNIAIPEIGDSDTRLGPAGERKSDDTESSYECWCSMLEIYNERVSDLLDDDAVRKGSSKALREDVSGDRGVFVEGLCEREVHSPCDAARILAHGRQNRRVAPTAMNSESSRSHMVFTVRIQVRSCGLSNNGLTVVRSSRLHMVDLAGSERQSATGATGLRLKEATNINQSLSTLGNVIRVLSLDKATQSAAHAPYRDSKLTFLLKDSLGGNARTMMVCTVSADARWLGETLSTLKFAERAKCIRNRVAINESKSGSITQLQREVCRLQAMLKAERLQNGTADAERRRENAESQKDQLEKTLIRALERDSERQQQKIMRMKQIQQLKEHVTNLESELSQLRVVLTSRDNRIAHLQMEASGSVVHKVSGSAEQDLKELQELKMYMERAHASRECIPRCLAPANDPTGESKSQQAQQEKEFALIRETQALQARLLCMLKQANLDNTALRGQLKRSQSEKADTCAGEPDACAGVDASRKQEQDEEQRRRFADKEAKWCAERSALMCELANVREQLVSNAEMSAARESRLQQELETKCSQLNETKSNRNELRFEHQMVQRDVTEGEATSHETSDRSMRGFGRCLRARTQLLKQYESNAAKMEVRLLQLQAALEAKTAQAASETHAQSQAKRRMAEIQERAQLSQPHRARLSLQPDDFGGSLASTVVADNTETNVQRRQSLDGNGGANIAERDGVKQSRDAFEHGELSLLRLELVLAEANRRAEQAERRARLARQEAERAEERAEEAYVTLAYKEEALAKAEGRGHELQAELSKAQVDTERLQREHQELDARYSQTNAEKMRLTQALNKSRLPGGLMDCRSPSYKMRNKEQQMRQTQAQMEVQLERAQRRIQKLQQENAALREVDTAKERTAPAALAPPPPLPPPPVSIAPAALPDTIVHMCDTPRGTSESSVKRFFPNSPAC